MQYYRLLRFLVLPFALLLPVTSFGTSIVRLSLEQTVAQAEWIVEGDVVRNWCGWDSGHRFIWTHTEITVRNRWKGAPGKTVMVSEPGGTVNGMGLEVVGMVRYAPGEHVVVFLYRTPIGLIRTVGLAQGKLQVDNRGRVHPESAMAPLAAPVGVRSAGTSVSELEAGSLSEVHDRIMKMADGPAEVRK